MPAAAQPAVAAGQASQPVAFPLRTAVTAGPAQDAAAPAEPAPEAEKSRGALLASRPCRTAGSSFLHSELLTTWSLQLTFTEG